MKRNLIKLSLAVFFLAALMVDASAQRRGGRRGNNTNPPDQQQTNNPTTGNSNGGNIPIRVDSSGLGSGLDTTSRKTLRWDGAFAPDTSNAMNPLDYEYLRKDDALYAEKVWRELDLREKMNQIIR